MKTSIATVSLSGDLAGKLEAIARAGFDAVEIFENDLLAYDHSPEDIGEMARNAALAISLFQPFRDFEGMPDGERKRAFDRAERKFDIMAEIGTDLMLVCSNVSPLALGGIDRAAADLHELGERAAERGLRIGFEALAWGRFINDHRDAWEAVRRADHPAVGLILDSFHTLARKIDLDSIGAIPKDKIFFVQLADAPQIDLDLLSWSRHFRNMPGQGDLPVADFMRAVTSTGYDGYWSLEVFNDQFRAGAARQVAVDGRRSLIYLADRIGETGVALPPRAPCQAVEFIEFAADEGSAERLELLFRGMGFRKLLQHKSKDVIVWRQGSINLVVNREREGFAHAFYDTHGVSVCAIGLRVANAQVAISRAETMLAAGFKQPVLTGELEIPAARGVGGSLLYFLDRVSRLGDVWNVEFDKFDDDDSGGTGLSSVDHLSQSMGYEEMLSWLLFYTSIFDLEKTPSLEIADPAGLVRSQVVQSSDGSVRIALNGSQSERTLSSKFVHDFVGSGVQHIALATDDILETARRLSANGLDLLPMPANYYDDLRARFGLDDDFLTELAAHGVLYDRDASGGEYLQLYTPAFAERFFFEIVQRRGGYTGFGAPNAPIRLAAQDRLSRRYATTRTK